MISNKMGLTAGGVNLGLITRMGWAMGAYKSFHRIKFKETWAGLEHVHIAFDVKTVSVHKMVHQTNIWRGMKPSQS